MDYTIDFAKQNYKDNKEQFLVLQNHFNTVLGDSMGIAIRKNRWGKMEIEWITKKINDTKFVELEKKIPKELDIKLVKKCLNSINCYLISKASIGNGINLCLGRSEIDKYFTTYEYIMLADTTDVSFFEDNYRYIKLDSLCFLQIKVER